MKVSKVVLIVVALHVLVIGGIFIFEGCARSKAPTSDMTDSSTPAGDESVANAPALPATPTADSSDAAQNLTPTTPTTPTTTPATAAPMPATTASATPAPAVTARVYVVKKGDSLWKIAKAQGVSIGDMARANNITKTSQLKVGQKLQVPALAKADTAATTMASATPATAGDVSAPAQASAGADAGSQMYVVKSGDSLWKIAHAQNLSVSALKQANNLSGDSIKVGQKLHIPAVAAATPAATTASNTSGPQPAGVNAGIATASYSDWHEPGTAVENGQTVHYVDAGESPAAIAKKYGVKVEDLMKANNITDAKRIVVGQRLVIPSAQPAPAATSASAGSTATPAVAAPMVSAQPTALVK
jgi:LysM repeat protein